MKKCLAFLLSVVMCISLMSTAMAANPIISNDGNNFSYIWITLRDSGKLMVGNDGLLYVEENNNLTDVSGYDAFIDLINVCNESISDGILMADAEAVEIKSIMQYDEEQVPYALSSSTKQNSNPRVAPYNVAHGCSVQACSLITMCQNNYNTLQEYYEDMLQLSLVNPNLSPWGATVGFWINKVQPYGDWDYKRQIGFKPYDSEFCCYFNSNFNHVTSEYIGNFNYGYTGSYLFSLDVLHFGSAAVDGFTSKDLKDWPAIDAGYENAPNT